MRNKYIYRKEKALYLKENFIHNSSMENDKDITYILRLELLREKRERKVVRKKSALLSVIDEASLVWEKELTNTERKLSKLEILILLDNGIEELVWTIKSFSGESEEWNMIYLTLKQDFKVREKIYGRLPWLKIPSKAIIEKYISLSGDAKHYGARTLSLSIATMEFFRQFNNVGVLDVVKFYSDKTNLNHMGSVAVEVINQGKRRKEKLLINSIEVAQKSALKLWAELTQEERKKTEIRVLRISKIGRELIAARLKTFLQSSNDVEKLVLKANKKGLNVNVEEIENYINSGLIDTSLDSASLIDALKALK